MADDIPTEAEAMIEAVCFREGVDSELVMDRTEHRHHITRARKQAWAALAERWPHRLIASWFGMSQQSVSQGIARLKDAEARGVRNPAQAQE